EEVKKDIGGSLFSKYGKIIVIASLVAIFIFGALFGKYIIIAAIIGAALYFAYLHLSTWFFDR
ncbi:MAG: hypothetical protein K6F94_05815, partial [Bacteroidaceae bacterium]|nr:hypothetical protein [Bacteroidaceae bacterium]